jgi:hypothetical protein
MLQPIIRRIKGDLSATRNQAQKAVNESKKGRQSGGLVS